MNNQDIKKLDHVMDGELLTNRTVQPTNYWASKPNHRKSIGQGFVFLRELTQIIL